MVRAMAIRLRTHRIDFMLVAAAIVAHLGFTANAAV